MSVYDDHPHNLTVIHLLPMKFGNVFYLPALASICVYAVFQVVAKKYGIKDILFTLRFFKF